jgi:trans-aconitate 2-methyltransferase
MVEKKEHYTFGDTDLAAERLRLLARVFEPSSARLLSWLGPNGGAAALDLGCGPGHTTRLLLRHTSTNRVYGLDQSARLLAAAAREHSDARLIFVECDVTVPPFPVPPAALLYARFLLTHLRSPALALHAWASASLPGARLVLEETAFMTAEHPAFSRYYGLVERMQAHYGQRMYIGRELGALALASAPEWTVERSEVVVSPLPAVDMARLHLLNLRTWSRDPFAQANYESSELAELEASLAQIASGVLEAPPVSLGMGQVVLRRS